MSYPPLPPFNFAFHPQLSHTGRSDDPPSPEDSVHFLLAEKIEPWASLRNFFIFSLFFATAPSRTAKDDLFSSKFSSIGQNDSAVSSEWIKSL